MWNQPEPLVQKMLARRVLGLGAVAARLAVRAVVVSAAPFRAASTIDFGGVSEVVYERADFPKAVVQKAFAKDTLAMLGYGTQGRGQALNARDNGLNIIVGLREGGGSWKAALEDGWVPGKNLFNVDEASKRGSIIMYLLSDAGQKAEW